jgi:hypothetical protein
MLEAVPYWEERSFVRWVDARSVVVMKEEAVPPQWKEKC